LSLAQLCLQRGSLGIAEVAITSGISSIERGPMPIAGCANAGCRGTGADILEPLGR
jgi:hypothetical protein